MPKIRVLVVDDSALVRGVLSRGLRAEPDLEVVGTASNPYEARDLLVRLRPDVMTLDVEMPWMDGVTFLGKVMAVLPLPVIVLSSLTGQGTTLAQQALDAGAFAVVEKPSAQVGEGLERMVHRLAAMVRQAQAAGPRAPRGAAAPPSALLERTTDRVIGLGASTGGVAALTRILPMFPASTPAIVVVQHMPAGFTADFARRLSGSMAMRITEAQHGDRLLRGHVFVAPGGDRHLEVERVGGEYRIVMRGGPPVSGHRPSVDVFFRSLARAAGKNASAALLTGMGADGAEGLLALKQAGGYTVIQDKATCAVWGMPAAAHELGAHVRDAPLDRVPLVLLEHEARVAGGTSALRPTG